MNPVNQRTETSQRAVGIASRGEEFRQTEQQRRTISRFQTQIGGQRRIGLAACSQLGNAAADRQPQTDLLVTRALLPYGRAEFGKPVRGGTLVDMGIRQRLDQCLRLFEHAPAHRRHPAFEYLHAQRVLSQDRQHRHEIGQLLSLQESRRHLFRVHGRSDDTIQIDTNTAARLPERPLTQPNTLPKTFRLPPQQVVIVTVQCAHEGSHTAAWLLSRRRLGLGLRRRHSRPQAQCVSVSDGIDGVIELERSP